MKENGTQSYLLVALSKICIFSVGVPKLRLDRAGAKHRSTLGSTWILVWEKAPNTRESNPGVHKLGLGRAGAKHGSNQDGGTQAALARAFDYYFLIGDPSIVFAAVNLCKSVQP